MHRCTSRVVDECLHSSFIAFSLLKLSAKDDPAIVESNPGSVFKLTDFLGKIRNNPGVAFNVIDFTGQNS